jgi:PEGA domain
MQKYIFAGVACVALGACATVTRGTTNQIQIRSEPSGAQVTTSLAHACTTPCTITVNRKEEFTVLFRLQGYEDQTTEVRSQIAGAGVAGFAGNVIVGGVIGMGVDAATGSTLEHVPNPVVAIMQRSTARQPGGRPAQRGAAPAQAPVASPPPLSFPPPPPPAAPGIVPGST